MATQKRKRAPGGGRKPKAYTILKRRLETEKVEDAERAFDLHVKVMDNASESITLRLAAADWVACRVLGKPRQSFSIGDLSDAEILERVKPVLARFGICVEPPDIAGIQITQRNEGTAVDAAPADAAPATGEVH